ncbi:MAG TPA: hypothetical protein VN668_01630 [Stellaceae bacterium]|nr:hypothetical protein [Stellaceae bacterium]
MRHLLGGIAVAALLAAGLPAAAQMSNTAHQPPLLSSPPAPRAQNAAPAQSAQAQNDTSTEPQSGTSTAQQPAPSAAEPAPGATNGGTEGQSTQPAQHKPAKAAKRGAHHATQKVAQNRHAEDNMAEQLNQQELQRVQQGSTSSSGSTAPAGSTMSPAPGGTAPQH